MKRSSSLVIIIPLTVAAIVIGLVFVMRGISKASEPVKVPTATTLPALQDVGDKPTNGFSGMTGSTPAASDLEMDLNTATDTLDTSEIDALQTEASAL